MDAIILARDVKWDGQTVSKTEAKVNGEPGETAGEWTAVLKLRLKENMEDEGREETEIELPSDKEAKKPRQRKDVTRVN